MSEDNKPAGILDPSQLISSLFSSQSSASGEEEMVRIASTYALQLDARQIRTLLLFHAFADNVKTAEDVRKVVERLVERFMEYKKYNLSNNFIMAVIEAIALRKLIQQVDVSVAKKG